MMITVSVTCITATLVPVDAAARPLRRPAEYRTKPQEKAINELRDTHMSYVFTFRDDGFFELAIDTRDTSVTMHIL